MSHNPSRVVRYLRTPKGLFTLVLLLLTAISATQQGWPLVLPGLVAAIVSAVLVDAPIIRWREGAWSYPDGALLTGWLVAMILTPHGAWYVAAITSMVAVLSKYPLRAGKANLFNPAAFGLVATFYIFDSGQNWWGALPELPYGWLVALFATGIYISVRLNKVPVVLAFLGVYYVLGTLTAFAGDPSRVMELFRAPDVHAALFFAFFMISDPPTSPARHRDQVIYGVIIAVVSYAVFELVGAAYFLLAGLLVANVWEGWRKTQMIRRRTRDPITATA